MSASHAATQLWDPNSSGGRSDGSGTWHSTKWWNGAADVAWTNGNVAVIGASTPGTYTMNLDSAVTSGAVTISNSTYIFTGSTWTLSSSMSLSSGVSAVFNCPISTPGQSFTVGANGGSLTLGGGYTSTGGNPSWNGTSTTSATGSTINVTNGTYTEGGTWACNGVTVNQTGGAVTFGALTIARTAPAIYNLSGGTMANSTAGIGGFSVSRGSVGILNISGTGLGASKGDPVTLSVFDPTDISTINVSGGTLIAGGGITSQPGASFAVLTNIAFFAGAVNYATNASAILNISGGTVAAKGFSFGVAAGTYTNNPVCQFNVTGGLIYLDSGGIALGSGVSQLTTPVINLSGGTIAATANWADSMPTQLTTTNGNLTLQAADTNGSSFNITMAGGLTGTGGLNKTGGGILTLSGADNYSGTTTVSNGQLTVSTAAATSIGPVSLSSGTTLSTVLAASGQSWTNAGMVLTNGATMDFSFGGFQLGSSASVIQVNGNLTLDSSDNCTIEGSSLLSGTFPLMTCSGTLTLTGGASLPTITSLPAGVSATLAQSGNTINLVVSSSPNSILNWGTLAAGSWDFTTADWVNAGSGSPVDYTDGIPVNLNDNGNNAVVITLNSSVTPSSVTANNTKAGISSYTITGPGSITGNTPVLVQGTGMLALATINTYTGGTTVNSGTLAINYGGDGSGPSALGEGSLTLNTGATIDNTSGSNVTLNALLPEYWNGNFTYAGSQTNLDLGNGPVVLGSSIVQVTVLSNMLTYDGSISDGGLKYQLAVQGPGTLTLKGASTYSGGTVLNSGKLNIDNGGDGGADSAIGAGAFTINGGAIDNNSGSSVQLQTAIPEGWNANFTFAGTSNLDLGSGTISTIGLTLTMQNGATLQTEGQMIALGSGAVATMTLTGNGTFQTGGNANNTGLSMIVNGGVFQMNKASSSSVHSIQALTVNANGIARVTGTGGQQVVNSTAGPVTLGGGTLDLFGSSETMYSITFNSGDLQNSSATPATLTTTNGISLKGASCNFDVATNSALTIRSVISGTGSLVKISPGTLKLAGTNTYTGSTSVSNGLLSFTTATKANQNYIVTSGELEALLDPTGAKLQMTMTNLTFASNTRLGFDLASGNFGDTTAPLISDGTLTMNGNVTVDVTNAPSDTGDDLLLSYTNRTGTGAFIAGNIPSGAYIFDKYSSKTVVLTYTKPAPNFTGVTSVQTGGVLSGLTFSGVNGPAGGSYEILSSTNLSLRPLSAWTPVQSGNFDGSGNLNVTIGVNFTAPQTYYLLAVP